MPTLQLPRPLRLFLLINVGLSVICAVAMRISKYVLHLPWQYSHPFLPFGRWLDLNCYRGRFEHFHQLAFFSIRPEAGDVFTYPAPLAVVFAAFFHLRWHVIATFLVVTFGLLFVLAGLLVRAMVRMGVSRKRAVLFLAATMVASYPLWFEFSLAQIEIVVLLLVAAGVLTFMRGHSYLAAVFFGIAASTKYYPGIYLALFLAKKEYRQFAVGLLTGVGVSLLSMWYVGPTIAAAYQGMKAGATYYHDHYIASLLTETSYDHSVLGFVKTVGQVWGHDSLSNGLITTYLAIAAAGGFVLLFARIRHLPVLNELLSLCVLSVLLPPTSHDYTLIQLYVPWGLLVIYTLQRARAGQSVQNLTATFLCFAFLFAAESEVVVHARSLSGQMKMVGLVGLLVLSLTRRWEIADGMPNPAMV